MGALCPVSWSCFCFVCVCVLSTSASWFPKAAESTYGLQLMPTLTPGLRTSPFSMAYIALCVSLLRSPPRTLQTRSPRLKTCLG